MPLDTAKEGTAWIFQGSAYGHHTAGLHTVLKRIEAGYDKRVLLATRQFFMAFLLSFCVISVTGCGAWNSHAKLDEPPAQPIDVDEGRQKFQTTCRACHALADARAAGVFGPDLDLLQPEASTVHRAIEDGPGAMPRNLLSGSDAELVARYVAQAAGNQLDQEGEGGIRSQVKRTDQP